LLVFGGLFGKDEGWTDHPDIFEALVVTVRMGWQTQEQAHYLLYLWLRLGEIFCRGTHYPDVVDHSDNDYESISS
jgi:hypothetical protein